MEMTVIIRKKERKFIQSILIDPIWNMVEKGHELPTMVLEVVKLPKPKYKWDDIDMKLGHIKCKGN